MVRRIGKGNAFRVRRFLVMRNWFENGEKAHTVSRGKRTRIPYRQGDVKGPAEQSLGRFLLGPCGRVDEKTLAEGFIRPEPEVTRARASSRGGDDSFRGRFAGG